MNEAGCFAINFGVESGSPAILTNIKKNITPNEIIKAIELTNAHSMIADIFMMVGNPGENYKTIKDTLRIIKKANPSSGGWGILTIFPDTDIYKMCKEKGYITDNFWLSDFSSPYYLLENSYSQQLVYLNKIKCFFLWKNKQYSLWLRYKLLELRDIFWIKTGIKLSFKKGIQILKNHRSLKKFQTLNDAIYD